MWALRLQRPLAVGGCAGGRALPFRWGPTQPPLAVPPSHRPGVAEIVHAALAAAATARAAAGSARGGCRRARGQGCRADRAAPHLPRRHRPGGAPRQFIGPIHSLPPLEGLATSSARCHKVPPNRRAQLLALSLHRASFDRTFEGAWLCLIPGCCPSHASPSPPPHRRLPAAARHAAPGLHSWLGNLPSPQMTGWQRTRLSTSPFVLR